jgi:hypothetical protein
VIHEHVLLACLPVSYRLLKVVRELTGVRFCSEITCICWLLSAAEVAVGTTYLC